MPVSKPLSLGLALLFLSLAALTVESVLPGSEMLRHAREAEPSIPGAAAGMPGQGAEPRLRTGGLIEAGPASIHGPEEGLLPTEDKRRSALRERAARFLRRCEAEIAWRFGRVAAR